MHSYAARCRYSYLGKTYWQNWTCPQPRDTLKRPGIFEQAQTRVTLPLHFGNVLLPGSGTALPNARHQSRRECRFSLVYLTF